jgi:hypothetical protein
VSVNGSGAEREGTSDAHHESHREHEAAEDFDDPRIARLQPCGAALEDLGEQSTEGEHGSGEELSSSDIIVVKTSRDDVARRRTALKKIISIRVWCLATAACTITTATSAGLSVLGVGECATIAFIQSGRTVQVSRKWKWVMKRAEAAKTWVEVGP